MTEWFYKATATKVSFKATFDLANVEGFICRSAYDEDGTRAANTQHVQFGDILHIYFVSEDTQTIVGTFEVVGPKRHPHPSLFKKGVAGTVLFEVDDAFAQRLMGLGMQDAEGYVPDPVLKKLTGWALLKRKEITTPSFAEAPASFKGRSTLVARRSS